MKKFNEGRTVGGRQGEKEEGTSLTRPPPPQPRSTHHPPLEERKKKKISTSEDKELNKQYGSNTPKKQKPPKKRHGLWPVCGQPGVKKGRRVRVSTGVTRLTGSDSKRVKGRVVLSRARGASWEKKKKLTKEKITNTGEIPRVEDWKAWGDKHGGGNFLWSKTEKKKN